MVPGAGEEDSARPSAAVLEKLAGLPLLPGVYLFKDREGRVVYVGKAKTLRHRVRSYFQEGSSDARAFIPILLQTIGDIDTVVTGSEKEATILENSLIKEYAPRFNVKLRDDKEFLSLRLDESRSWPRLELVRKPAQDGANYFGPFHSATAARRTLHLVNKHFQLRTCSDAEMATRKRPCLQFQIKRCPAPCVFEVDAEWYGQQVRSVALFLAGRHDELTNDLERRMGDAASRMQFELAAVYRDQLRAIDAVREEQRIVMGDGRDREAIGFCREGDVVEISRLVVHGGRLGEVVCHSFKDVEIPDEEVLSGFLAQIYAEGPVPDEVVVPLGLEGIDGIAEWLTELAGHAVSLVVPKRGPRLDLVTLANENAAHSFREKRRASLDVGERLGKLAEKLRLPTVPRRIECCDISHLGGSDTVGAIVAMVDGKLDKKGYRTFRVRGPGANGALAGDDYGAMYEVLARRFRRGLRASVPPPEEAASDSAEEPVRNGWDLPDLFVVDGGRGQLGVALAAAHDLGLHDLSIVGLAKERETVLGDEVVDRVYLPGQKNPVSVKGSQALLLLCQLRDEAHRFSNRGRETVGKARRFESRLDTIKGIGPRTKKTLLLRFGTVERVLSATDAELLATPGVNKRHVAALRAEAPARAGVSSTQGEAETADGISLSSGQPDIPGEST
jgi:excinuclease ABC subunit C